MRKVGIYGGTFSPPHIGHVEAARAFLRAVALDELIIIPTFTPPHKAYSGQVSADDRLGMCELAFSKLPKTSVSDLEIRRGGKSYTYLTLEELSSSDVELYLLCGTDMFITLDEWKNAERIFELAHICYLRRENDLNTEALIEQKKAKYITEYSARITAISHEVIEVSSTELRDVVSSGRNSELIPKDVFEFIERRGLYR